MLCLPYIDKEKGDGKVRRVALYEIGNYKVFDLFCLRWRKLTFLKKKISLNILKTQMPLFHVLAADQAFLVGPPLPSIWIPLSQSLLPWEQPTRNVLCVYQLGVQFVSIYILLCNQNPNFFIIKHNMVLVCRKGICLSFLKGIYFVYFVKHLHYFTKMRV